MDNRIKSLLEERDLSVARFSRESGIKASTLYAIVDGTTKFEKISIGTFIKIAEGLGMSAEELYYGEGHAPTARYADQQQAALNGYYESMNEGGQRLLVETAESISADPKRRIFKDGAKRSDSQAAMGA